MHIKDISSLFLVLFITACSSSHTERIKQQLGSEFNIATYENAGGEIKSLERYNTFCTAIKEKRYNKVTLQYEAIKSISNSSDLKLIDAEINLADKDCND